MLALSAKQPNQSNQRESEQEAQLLLGMADRTGPVVKLSYLRELVWQPSWELDNSTVLIG